MDLWERLDAAIRAHDDRAKVPWTGIYHFKDENEALGAVRRDCDAYLQFQGRWPEGKIAISNAECLRLLRVGE